MKPGQSQAGPLNKRQILLDHNEEQMIIKSAYASNHELIKCIEKANGHYLLTAQEEIMENERQFLLDRMKTKDPYLVPGDPINQASMFTAFKPYLHQHFVLFNDEHHLNRGLQPDTVASHDVLLAKLKRYDFENGLRDVENWKLDRLTDVILDLPVFSQWTKK